MEEQPASQVIDSASVAFGSFAESLNALALQVRAEETIGAISVELERVSLFVNSSEAQQRAQSTPAVTQQAPGNPESTANGGGQNGGGLTREQLQALARCESGLDPYAGDPSPWRTGYFGLEAGHPVGGLSLAEQEAEVQRIYAQYGSSAWGCPIR